MRRRRRGFGLQAAVLEEPPGDRLVRRRRLPFELGGEPRLPPAREGVGLEWLTWTIGAAGRSGASPASVNSANPSPCRTQWSGASQPPATRASHPSASHSERAR